MRDLAHQLNRLLSFSCCGTCEGWGLKQITVHRNNGAAERILRILRKRRALDRRGFRWDESLLTAVPHLELSATPRIFSWSRWERLGHYRRPECCRAVPVSPARSSAEPTGPAGSRRRCR